MSAGIISSLAGGSKYPLAGLWPLLAYNPVRYNIDVHSDHGDCCICHEPGRYSTSKVGQLLPPPFSFSGTRVALHGPSSASSWLVLIQQGLKRLYPHENPWLM